MRTLLLTLIFLVAMPLQAAETKATVLYYRVSEPGIEPYLSRWLITPNFLRIDEGDEADNYLLFDRRKRTIYSVVHGDRTVLDIPYRAVERKPSKLLPQESRAIHDDKMPGISGQPAIYRELYVGKSLCYSVISVEQLLPDAVQAMRDYRTVLAGEQAKTLDNTPLELQDPCDLTLHIFSPLWLLEKGLPIQEWSPQGKASALLNYKIDEMVSSELFALPKEYRHYQTQEIK
ncbi:MAG TPA: hypothetical protein VGE50_02970 [Gammaproteobacteria bacterium]